jgi:hypothetical protein
MDQELIAYLDERFRETSQQIAELREETTRQFEQVDHRFEQAETTARQTLVVLEGLRHEVHVVAEGFLGLHEKLERYRADSTASFELVRGWIEPYYRMLDGRLSVMEGRADRQQGDVMEAVRRILARPPLQPPVPSSD